MQKADIPVWARTAFGRSIAENSNQKNCLDTWTGVIDQYCLLLTKGLSTNSANTFHTLKRVSILPESNGEFIIRNAFKLHTIWGWEAGCVGLAIQFFLNF